MMGNIYFLTQSGFQLQQMYPMTCT